VGALQGQAHCMAKAGTPHSKGRLFVCERTCTLHTEGGLGAKPAVAFWFIPRATL